MIRPHAFVAMPFGIKPGADGKPIDFNRVYREYIGWSGARASPSDSPALRRARRGRRPDGCARRSPASRSGTDDHARSQSLAGVVGVVGMPESEGPGLSSRTVDDQASRQPCP